MPQNVTLKDVAREAHVSVATVSYIINNRPDQKISDATRKKVLQIANLLGYTPNPVAKSLATGKKDLVGIVYRLRENTPSRNMEILHFIDLLAQRLNPHGYECLLLPADVTDITLHRVDSVIVIGLSQEEFSSLADNCFVPILTVDMLVNDPLFSQIYSDLPSLIARASGSDPVLITEPYGNRNYGSFVTEGFSAGGILSPSQCSAEALQGRDVVIIGAPLALIVRPLLSGQRVTVIASDPMGKQLPPEMTVLWSDVAEKADVTTRYLLDAMEKKFDAAHDCKV